MNPELLAFLTDLADVLEKHKGGLTYTSSDDGVHVVVGTHYSPRNEISIGWPEDGDVSEIRKIIKGNTA